MRECAFHKACEHLVGVEELLGHLPRSAAVPCMVRLDAADPTDDLVFLVRGEGVTGQATLRVEPGQTRDLVIEVRAKPK